MTSRDVPASVAERLDHLFQTIPDPQGKPYTNEAAAQALGRLGVSVTGQHLWQLRNGKRDNPSFKLLDGICRLFGVPLDYFSSDTTAAKVTEELATLAALRAAGVDTLLARAAGLSPESIRGLAEIASTIRKMEGLDGESTGEGISHADGDEGRATRF